MTNIPYSLIGKIATNKKHGSLELLIKLMKVFPEYENELKENEIWKHYLHRIKRNSQEKKCIYKKHDIYNFFKSNWNSNFKTCNMKPIGGCIGDHVIITMTRQLQLSYQNLTNGNKMWIHDMIPRPRTVGNIVCSENIILIKVDNPTGLYMTVLDQMDSPLLGPEITKENIVIREIIHFRGQNMILMDAYWANVICIIDFYGQKSLHCLSIFKNQNDQLDLRCERVQIIHPSRSDDIVFVKKTQYHCGPTPPGTGGPPYHFMGPENEFYQMGSHRLYEIHTDNFKCHAIFGHFNDTNDMYKIVPSNILPLPLQNPHT